MLDRSLKTYESFAEKFKTLTVVRQLFVLDGGTAALGRRFNTRPDLTDPSDLRLKKVLQQWYGIEPRPDFESRVWRRIRAAACPISARAAEKSAAPGLWLILRAWAKRFDGAWARHGKAPLLASAKPLAKLGRRDAGRRSLAAEQAWEPAMAATAGLLVGIALALSAPQTRADHNSAAPLLHSQTLAGAYLTMVSGGAR